MVRRKAIASCACLRYVNLDGTNEDGQGSLPMTPAQLIAPVTAAGGATDFGDLGSWSQGRTLYGGASALIAYTAAQRAFPGLPPLRAAQIAFVAPTGPQTDLRREIVRQGRNVTHVRSEIWCEGQCTLTAFFLFGGSRHANAVYSGEPAKEWFGPPEEAEEAMKGKGPEFLQSNFELRYAQDERGPGDPVVRRWARLSQRDGLDPVSEIILLGDVLPPGAMRAMQRAGPISSINWSFNLLTDVPATRDGWWLSENASQYAEGGYSSERLRLWNTGGEQVTDGIQSVAIFG